MALLAAAVGCDTLAVNAALIGAYSWRYSVGDLNDLTFPDDPLTIPLFLVLINVVFMATFIGTGLYVLRRGVSRVDEMFKVVVALSLGMFGALVVNSFLTAPVPLTPALIAICWGSAVLATVLLRLFYRTLLYALRRRGFDSRRVVIVGAREPGQVIAETIARSPELGYHVQGFVSNSAEVGSLVHGIPVLGRPDVLGEVIRDAQADEVIIALSGRSSAEVMDIVALAEDEAVEIKIYPDAFQLIINPEVTVGDLSGLPLLPVKNVALDNPINRAMKRALDIVFSSVVLLLLSPVMVLIALLVRLESRGPVFFIQERVGLDGKPFPTIKFRTMRSDAPQISNWTVENDPRITTIGRFLRRYSLDELPQFINVLRGEMSVVGPRPEQPRWVEEFSRSIPRYVRRHRQKAGITGWAQVNGLRGDTSIEERTRYDLYYVENWSLLFDIKIIIKTAVGVFTGKVSGY
ncbi:undecaprenyl-phosphate glucose phosphotransferase [Chloroflexia bacterium SDU3-3]|nr:undecaprenyl-phosphate glucose phosphotransferase [Chloroflexia bacterium SDU3-3]